MSTGAPTGAINQHNEDAEDRLVGAIMIRPEILPNVKHQLEPSSFFFDRPKSVYQAILNVEGETIDYITVNEELKKINRAEYINYMCSASEHTYTSAGYQAHIDVINGTYQLRTLELDLKKALSRIQKADNPLEIAASLRQEMQGYVPDIDMKDNADKIMEAYRDIERRAENDDPYVGVLTGFSGIDRVCFGQAPKETTYIGAKRHTGKTIFGLQVADYIARNNDGVFLFFSLESNVKALVHRCFARMAQIQLNKIRTGRISLDSDWNKLSKCVEEMTRSGLLLYDESKFRYIENIYQHCEAISQEHNILGIGIDYLQILNTKKPYASKHLRYGAIADELNFMAKDFNTHIFCMSQLNDDDMLKESRDIEDCATNVWKLKKDVSDNFSETIILDCVKGKETGLFQVNLSIDGALMTMEEV